MSEDHVGENKTEDASKEVKEVEVTEEHFKIFQDAVNTQKALLGLTEWKIVFKKKKLEDEYASIHSTFNGRVAVVTLCSIWWEGDSYKLTTENLQQTAAHEVFHLLVAELYHLATRRFVSESELDRAEESVIRRLENTYGYGGKNAG